MLNYSLIIAVICICARHTHAATPILCTEQNTEFNAACNNCTEQCLKDPQQYCPFFCADGCYCKQGYNRAPNGTCIPTGNCPIQCPLNEKLQHGCVDSCYGNQYACKPGSYGCFCKQGFKRIDGKCVPEANCYSK